ncbi:hypothetical protein GCM10008986_07130 [Salinibacillus aidingensis]|uniref:Uncharacterized protein n=1 Tax=Salinibacillus aidingensis TaxID=237684 RepID=A0ABN1AV15_9BACI
MLTNYLVMNILNSEELGLILTECKSSKLYIRAAFTSLPDGLMYIEEGARSLRGSE